MHKHHFDNTSYQDELIDRSHDPDINPWGNTAPRPQHRWSWYHFLFIVMVAAIVIGLPLLLYHFRYSPARVMEDAVWQYEKILNGDTHFVESMVPPEYWETLSNKSGHEKSVEITKAKQGTNLLLAEYEQKYTEYKLQLEIIDEPAICSFKTHTAALARYGISPHTIGDCYQLTLQATIADFYQNTYLSKEAVYAIEIDDRWYLFYLEPDDRESFTFLLDYELFDYFSKVRR